MIIRKICNKNCGLDEEKLGKIIQRISENCKEGGEKLEQDQGKQELIGFVKELCLADEKVFGSDICFDLLCELNDNLGVRQYYAEVYHEALKTVSFNPVTVWRDFEDYRKRTSATRKPTPNNFWDREADVRSTEEGVEYSEKYACCKSTLLNFLYREIKKEKWMSGKVTVDLGSTQEFPFLEERSIADLEEFAYNCSIYFLNGNLPDLLEKYVDDVENKKALYKKGGKTALFRDMPGINISKRLLADIEKERENY